MVKHLFAAAVAAVICIPETAGQSLVQRSDWQDRKFETYLPRVHSTVPWLELDTKTKLPKGDIPLGRDVAFLGPFVLPSVGADTVGDGSAERRRQYRSYAVLRLSPGRVSYYDTEHKLRDVPLMSGPHRSLCAD